MRRRCLPCQSHSSIPAMTQPSHHRKRYTLDAAVDRRVIAESFSQPNTVGLELARDIYRGAASWVPYWTSKLVV